MVEVNLVGGGMETDERSLRNSERILLNKFNRALSVMPVGAA
jgi:hypothetical protein